MRTKTRVIGLTSLLLIAFKGQNSGSGVQVKMQNSAVVIETKTYNPAEVGVCIKDKVGEAIGFT